MAFNSRLKQIDKDKYFRRYNNLDQNCSKIISPRKLDEFANPGSKVCQIC